MRRLRHLALLVRDVTEMAADVGALWLLPVVLLFLVLGLLITTANTALPYVVYTFF